MLKLFQIDILGINHTLPISVSYTDIQDYCGELLVMVYNFILML